MAEKNKGGRPAYKPTEQDIKTVEIMTACGIPQEDVARCIGGGITVKTLRKHFGEELATAKIKANAKMGQQIFNQAMSGNTAAAIWWSKTQMGWKEARDEPVIRADESTTIQIIRATKDNAD